MSEFTYLTQDGYDRLREELELLKTEERPRVSSAIAEAREKGDLSENAEYHAAKDEQGLLEYKINLLEVQLAGVRILDKADVDTSKVSLLTSVTIRNKKSNKEVTYTIVSEAEADLKAKKIASTSPVGKGLMGKKEGDIALVETPRGNIEFEVIKISI